MERGGVRLVLKRREQTALVGGGAVAQQCEGGRRVAGENDFVEAHCIGLGSDLDAPGAEAALLFPTGYQANLSLIGGLCGPGDVILIRSGWGRRWGLDADYTGHTDGVYGVAVSPDGAAGGPAIHHS